MLKPVQSVLELIGGTPMVKLNRISKDIPSEIWAKLEFLNPSGSVKDRIALTMIEEAEKRGDIKKGGIVIEPTTGNTGIALALVCALKGYKMIAVMPEVVSKERKMIIELLGGQVDIVKCCDKEKGVTKEDMEKVVARAKELLKTYPNSFMPNQFDNEDNPRAHDETTASEIIAQTGGRFNAFVAACGTGGTFSGIARVLKERLPKIKNVVVEPSTSAVISGCEPGHHKIQGIGEGFIPKVMDVNLVDEIAKVSSEEAIETAKRLWKEEGIMGGFSSGANVFASLKIGEMMNKGDVIITLIPDSGMRYLSMPEFQC
jgi:cysteine synthase A